MGRGRGITLTENADGKLVSNIEENYSQENLKSKRRKGRSLLDTPKKYTVIDIETTGLDPECDEIIELSAIKVENGEILSSFSSLIKPDNFDLLSDFIIDLTGITPKLLRKAPPLHSVIQNFIDFIGTDIVVGHNVNFDINFIYDNFERISGQIFSNDFVDLLRMSRRVFPNFKNHKLTTVAKCLEIEQSNAHRGLVDCETTFKCFEACKKYIKENDLKLSSELYPSQIRVTHLVPENTDFDTTHPIYGKNCVFTGTLEKIQRKDAMQLVVNLGGSCSNTVTLKTNYLILGSLDYCRSKLKSEKSSKMKKVEELMSQGQDIQIISENVFYDMLEDALNVVKDSDSNGSN